MWNSVGRRWLGAVAVCFAAGPALVSAEGPAVPRKLHGKLVCVGDSICAGESVTRAESYPGRLGAKAVAAHDDLAVVGQGRSGWSTRSYVENLAAVARDLPADATVVTIQLGTNDTRDHDTPAAVADACVANVQKLIAAYHARAPAARFVIVTPVAAYPERLTKRLRDANYNDRTPAKLAAIRDAYAALAKRLGAGFVDVSALPGAEHSVDGVHPDAAGHAMIADAVWRGLTGDGRTTR